MLGSLSLTADVTYEESFVSSVDLSNYMPALFDYPYGRESEFDSGGYVIATFDPTRLANFHVYIKGGKMARVGALASVIYDLERGTVTSMDWRKRTFSVLTFAQMEQQIERDRAAGKTAESPSKIRATPRQLTAWMRGNTEFQPSPGRVKTRNFWRMLCTGPLPACLPRN